MSAPARKYMEPNRQTPSLQSGLTTKFEQLQLATEIIKNEAEALKNLASNLPDDFCVATDLLLECEGCVIVTGIGKAGWIGQKTSASLASVGVRSPFPSPRRSNPWRPRKSWPKRHCSRFF